MVHHSHSGISHPDDDAPDVTVTIEATGGDEDAVEKVLMHTKDECVRALQALHEEQHPDDCDGVGFSVAWDRVLGLDEENGGEA